jgi:hypothetical protein
VNLSVGDIIVIAVVAVVLIFGMPYIILFIRWIMGRQSMVEKQRDAHEMLFKKRAKAAKLHMRGGNLKKLMCLGDQDQYPIKIGRIVGIIQGPFVTEIFFKPRRLRPTRWALIPAELHGTILARELVLSCNGLQPVGNFYEPVWSRSMPEDRVRFMMTMIDDYEKYLVMREEGVELLEQKVNSWYTAINVRQVNQAIITREDYLRKTPGNPEEGKAYGEEKI